MSIGYDTYHLPHNLATNSHHEQPDPSLWIRDPYPALSVLPVNQHYTHQPRSNDRRLLGLQYDPTPRSYRPPYRQRALLIGVNYFGQRGELGDCVDNVRSMSQYLIETFQYQREQIVVLTDDQLGTKSQPTMRNILCGMHWLVKDSQPGDKLFLYYSGHTRVVESPDEYGEPVYDEAIYPMDFRQRGHITDDEMYRIVGAPLQNGVQLTVVFDSYHLITHLALPYLSHTQGMLKDCYSDHQIAGDWSQGLVYQPRVFDISGHCILS